MSHVLLVNENANLRKRIADLEAELKQISAMDGIQEAYDLYKVIKNAGERNREIEAELAKTREDMEQLRRAVIQTGWSIVFDQQKVLWQEPEERGHERGLVGFVRDFRGAVVFHSERDAERFCHEEDGEEVVEVAVIPRAAIDAAPKDQTP